MSFLGAGSYNHYVPSVVRSILQRGEFVTAYTPNQPEAAQGTLQVGFEFQTIICQLTGMEVANARMYDGPTAFAIAKRLLDFGIHAPTMYFPMIVEEALMIEPTESESKETLDHFIAVMRQIDEEANYTPELIIESPHDLPVTRLDEVTAARKPILRWAAVDSDDQ